jgi:signal transduction histidine kinase
MRRDVARRNLHAMQRAIDIPRRQIGQLRWNQDYVDVIVGVFLALAALFSIANDYSRLDPISAPLLILQTLPIAWRRRSPMRVLWITGVSITVYSILRYPVSVGYLGVFSAFYTVAAYESRRRATVAAAITGAGVLISFIAYAHQSMPDWQAGLVQAYLAYGLAWVLGDNLRVRRAYTAQLEERANLLELEREEKAIQAVAEERSRIARELHDVVAHHVSVMVVQAGGARRVADKDPALAREALAAVEEAGRTALSEMRRMLEVLRDDSAGMGPQPGLSDLERLVGQVREAGLPVEIGIEGDERLLPAGMDLAAYRIIQEALTNAVKHAGKANARVSVRYEPEALDIEVVDDGRGAAAPLLTGTVEGGHGLIGMRERVTLYGGELQTGPVFPGGYRVHARFPLEPPAKGSVATCCEEESALSSVAAAAERDRERAERAERGTRPGASAHAASPRFSEPAPLVKPRVVPPLIGRVVPPQPRPAAPRPTRHTQGQAPAPHGGESPSKAKKSDE